ncbi:MAG: hypothetical protein EHM17_02295 [Verrucomicrobiaceae bacterium]|nr:MAG: hypothetical protein EHM17_02295 [Verrucomicrobiaceae bacterium]
MTSAPDPIVCKPTPWFLFRALVILLMFGVFAVLFYIDGSTGYRKKNEVFYLHRAFQQASEEFAKRDTEGALTPAAWQEYAAAQAVKFPEDRSVLPAALELPVPWPEILHDYERMKPLQWKKLWLEYSKTRGFDAEPPEEPYDARKIGEQWVVFWACLALAIGSLFILVRTLGRKISADAEAITSQQGRRVPYAELKTLDLRKWETKGLAFIDYDGPSGKGRIRIDGLTYGGFKKEQGEPAERLMDLIRSRFSGEVIEYAPLLATPEPDEKPPGTA